MIYTKSIHSQKCYDVAVVGGGFSGFAAAYSSAREGKKTILVERGACIGGVGTQGLVNQILGIRTRYEGGYKTCIKGLCRELEERVLNDKEGIDFKTYAFNTVICLYYVDHVGIIKHLNANLREHTLKSKSHILVVKDESEPERWLPTDRR